VGRDDFVKLNRNASAANLIQISPAFFPDSRRAQLQISKTKYRFFQQNLGTHFLEKSWQE